MKGTKARWKGSGGCRKEEAGKKQALSYKLPFQVEFNHFGFCLFFMVFVYVVICLGEGAESIVREEAEAVWNWRGFATKEGSEPIR